MAKQFAVIDTETNWENEVMSVGIVIAEEPHFEPLYTKYIIFDEASAIGGMYSSALFIEGQTPEVMSKKKGISAVKAFLKDHGVKTLFAYNAAFDCRCMPELCHYDWRDILKIAAYKQHNPAIPRNANCFGTGRLKSGYRVEDIMHMLGETHYAELHNALTDAIDELRMMKLLSHPTDMYPCIT